MTSRQKPLTFSDVARGPTRTTPTRPCHSPRSEALECVQLAAAFAPACLQAGNYALGEICNERTHPL